MSNPRYSAEMRDRAVKMVMEVRRESGQVFRAVLSEHLEEGWRRPA